MPEAPEQDIHPKDQSLIERIDAVLAEYERVRAVGADAPPVLAA